MDKAHEIPSQFVVSRGDAAALLHGRPVTLCEVAMLVLDAVVLDRHFAANRYPHDSSRCTGVSINARPYPTCDWRIDVNKNPAGSGNPVLQPRDLVTTRSRLCLSEVDTYFAAFEGRDDARSKTPVWH